jgi:tRNA pseudouridine38-40 synthase
VTLAHFWAQVEYDGTDLAGFQLQARERTVQGELERALWEVTGVEARVTGAGRTDSGVHACGQIVSFEVEWRHALADLHRALNAVLPADVAIPHMGVAPPGFHPRFDALSRTYQYKVLTQPWRSPLDRRIAWHLPYQLDLDRMAQASHCLVGTHNFSTFGRPPQGENSVRTVSEAEWRDSGRFLVFDITANAFLYHMVRRMVYLQVLAGQKRIELADFVASIENKKSITAGLAPPYGLFLTGVEYPPDGQELRKVDQRQICEDLTEDVV